MTILAELGRRPDVVRDGVSEWTFRDETSRLVIREQRADPKAPRFTLLMFDADKLVSVTVAGRRAEAADAAESLFEGS